MFTMLIHTEDVKEQTLLEAVSKDVTSRISDEKVNIIYDINQGEWEPDCAVVNICAPHGLDYARELRARCPEVEIMLIADSTISPMKYLNPQIRPLSLVIMPYSEKELSGVIQELLQKLLSNENGGIWIDTLNGKVKLQYSSILYLEASNKMISIRLNSIEYSIYGSLDKYEQQLPDNFVRCHRSYIVNANRISKVKFSENYLVLDDQLRLPLSRTCKQAIREVIGHGNSEKEVLS